MNQNPFRLHSKENKSQRNFFGFRSCHAAETQIGLSQGSQRLKEERRLRNSFGIGTIPLEARGQPQVEINPPAKQFIGKIPLKELYTSSNAKSYGLTEEHFSEILTFIAAKSVPELPSTNLKSQTDFYRSLKIEELALARGCALEDEKAWEVFLTRYREKLYGSLDDKR